MATLFYEPSTRTRLSFESAMQRLGGSVISCSDMKASSTAKGETVADTAKVVSSYADVLVVRHYWDGAVQAMAEYADVPVINAGDGGHEHPTQTLCDLYTLKKEKGGLKGLTVVICGDLKNGRTIHSLVWALARFEANIVTLAANGMELPQYVLERLERDYGYSLAPVASGDLSAVVTETDALYLTPKQPHQLALFTEVDSVVQSRLNSMVSGLRYDAFYMTRKQKERMKEGTTGSSYPTIGAGFLREQRFKDTVVMHPLPRVDELSPEVDKDRRGIYFKQAAYGVPIRMALLKFLFDQGERKTLSGKQRATRYESPERLGPQCPNANCITLKEPSSTRRRFDLLFTGAGGALILRCIYCDHRFKVQLVGHAKSKRYCAYDIALADTIKGWLRKKELAIFNSIKEAEELGYEPYKSGPQRTVMDEAEIQSAVEAMSPADRARLQRSRSAVATGYSHQGFLAGAANRRGAGAPTKAQTGSGRDRDLQLRRRAAQSFPRRSGSGSNESQRSDDHPGRRCHLHRENRQKRPDDYFPVGPPPIGAPRRLDRPRPSRGAGEAELCR